MSEPPSQSVPWVWGCLIISQQGRCLVNCMVHAAPGVKIHLKQLCNMLVAVQNLAGKERGMVPEPPALCKICVMRKKYLGGHCCFNDHA